MNEKEKTETGRALMAFYQRLPPHIAKVFWEAFVLWREDELTVGISSSAVTFIGGGARIRFDLEEPAPPLIESAGREG